MYKETQYSCAEMQVIHPQGLLTSSGAWSLLFEQQAKCYMSKMLLLGIWPKAILIG